MLSQLMIFFGFFSLVLVSVYWINSAVRLFDRLISDGQSVWVFLELTALTLPNVIRLMLPISAFVAAVYTTNRMATESELLVMQATGFSPFRLARPVLYFGLIVALLLSVLTHFLVPASRGRLNERNSEIDQNVSAKLLTEGVFLHPSSGVTFYIRRLAGNGELTDIFLSDARKPGAAAIYTARRAYLSKSDSGPKLVMFDGMAQTTSGVAKGAQPQIAVTRFANLTYDIGGLLAASGPRHPELDERSTAELLWPTAALLAETGATRAAALFEAHDRFSKPLLSVAVALIGFAAMMTGNYTRFGLWRQIVLAGGLFILLFFLDNLATKIASQRAGMIAVTYLPAVIGLAAGAIILGWTVRRRPSPAPGRAVAA